MINWFHDFNELLNQWGYALGEMLQGNLEQGSLFAVGVVFLAGLVTSVTPCVYPMIPVTVTYIGGAAAGQRARAVTLSLVYVGGLAGVYTLLGVVSALVGRTFGTLSQSPWVNLAVGGIIVALAVGMLGLYNLDAFSGFFGRVQAKGARRGGYGGAFLMGIAAGFVAAPCTAPVLGILLVWVSRTQDVIWGGLYLFVFSLGLSALLLALGISAGLMTSLPRAGRWMDWVKYGFGGALLLLGLYYLYKAVVGFSI